MPEPRCKVCAAECGMCGCAMSGCEERLPSPATTSISIRQRFQVDDRRGQMVWFNITQWIISGGFLRSGKGTRTRQGWIDFIMAEGPRRMETCGMTPAEALESIWDDIVGDRLRD